VTWLFATAAAVLLLVALAIVLRPLVLRSAPGPGEAERSNLEILRDQLAELEADRRIGAIDDDQYQSARADLERRALEEAQPSPSSGSTSRSRTATATVVGLAIPVAAVLLYLGIGNPAAIDLTANPGADIASVSPDQFRTMTEQLAARLKQQPDDWEGWAMLGRAYQALERYEESARAWAEAAKLKPDSAEILADYAEALAVAKRGDLRGEPTRVLELALKLDPDNKKALALSGGAAFGREDYKAAIGYWERLLAVSGDEPELKEALESAIAKARSQTAAGATGKTVSGTVSVAPELAARVQPGDTVFVFARPADGSRMPLAIVRVQGENLPYDFTLDDTMAMASAKLSSVARVVVGARVSKSGNAQPSSGDLEGFSSEVRPGAQGVRVVINREVR
jgi:cytochrome c-type biogenesis protein CcmH